MSQIPEEACAPETDFDSDSDSETTAVPIQKSKHVQEWFWTEIREPQSAVDLISGPPVEITLS